MVVLDSSALIAFLREEPGGRLVETHLAEAVMSTVNIQEVAKKMSDAGGTDSEIRIAIDRLPLEIRPHDFEDALLAASLAPSTRKYGRGLGDRSCMALAIRLGAPALTTDRAWSELEIPGLEVRQLR